MKKMMTINTMVLMMALVVGVSAVKAQGASGNDEAVAVVPNEVTGTEESSGGDKKSEPADTRSETEGKSSAGDEGPDNPWMQDGAEGVDIPWERMMFGLGFVTVLVCVGVYLLKKFGGARFGNGRYMNVLETVPLGRDQRLALVQIGERVILLAIQKEKMEKVGEFSAEDMPAPEELEPQSEAGFGGILDGLMKGRK